MKVRIQIAIGVVAALFVAFAAEAQRPIVYPAKGQSAVAVVAPSERRPS